MSPISTDRLDIFNYQKRIDKNNEQIRESSLSVKKMFDVNFKAFITNFYSKLDSLTLRLVNLGANKEIIKNYSREMVGMMQSEFICRNKYVEGKLDEYTTKELKDIQNKIFNTSNLKVTAKITRNKNGFYEIDEKTLTLLD